MSSTTRMNEATFIAEVLVYKDKVYGYLISKVYDHDLAEDLLQEVFAKLWVQRSRLDKVENIEAWIIRIARNHHLDWHKSQKARILALTTERQTDIPGPEARLNHKDLVSRLQMVLEQLPKLQAEIFRLRELQGFSHQEIQAMLQLNETQVKVYLHRARKQVRSLLTKMFQH